MKKPIQILLIEDNELDIRMILHSAEKTKLHNNIKVVHEGGTALKQLQNCNKDDMPDLILLDLSLPGISGLEFLNIIKNEEQTSGIPVVVLTSSAAEEDIKQAYENHASAFITKPIEVSGFQEIVLAIDEFFFEIVSLSQRRQD